MKPESLSIKALSRWLPPPLLALAMGCFFAVSPPMLAASTDDFFETRIRPVLTERCFKCHSAQAEKLKGNLLLDSRDAAIKGGDTGPAIVPGAPEKSLLIKALSYADPDLQMPPSKSGGKLTDAQIADFKNWIEQGVAWPALVAAKTESNIPAFNLENRRREHWAWQPVKTVTPPQVKNFKWPANPIDNFILAQLDAKGIKPAPASDKRTLIRRATFDLIGLPPTSGEVDAFLRDHSKDAFAKVVDRLLASPRFGERWARHWLDRVRYSETMGHEFDYPILQAWRYRDYVIRALNEDVPYNRFVIEQLAGDLLPDPRIEPGSGVNESAAATAFYWFVQQVHSPVDIRQEQADIIDNQIDVVSKAFLGMTVACARCHDHKFDAISTKDFYSLYGVLSSSRYSAGILNSAAMIEAAKPLPQMKAELRGQVARAWEVEAKTFAGQLLATTNGAAAKGRMAAALDLEQIRSPAHPFYAWSRAASSRDFGVATRNLVGELDRKSAAVRASSTNYEDLPDLSKWFRDGPGFGRAEASDFLLGTNSAQPVAALIVPGEMHSGTISSRLQGELRSPTFTIEKRFVHALAAGPGARLRVVIDNFTLIRSPIYGGLHRRLENDTPRWITFDLEMWRGHRAYLEMSANAVNDPASETPAPRGKNSGEDPWGALGRAVCSDTSTAPPPAIWPAMDLLKNADSLAVLAEEYQKEMIGAIRAWAAGSMNASQFCLLDWAIRNRIWPEFADGEISNLTQRIFKIEEQIPPPVFVATMTDGTPLNESVFIRGSHRKTGEVVARCFLRGLEGPEPKPFTEGSGRLELARKIADPKNPFTARVMVNSVWHHLFGRGIVPTVDNFGVLGEKPSHPELLDWLAVSFVAPPDSRAANRDAPPSGGWSLKKLIREIMLSRAYQMSSAAGDLTAEERDPNNGLFHRMNVRRLEGETIRDSILAVSGSLDTTMFGEPVPVHLTPFMDGRGKPGHSGPLDGNGRRSIYQEVRRNFISPMMLAFDTPVPASTVGRRSVSNVPAQALILMNDPFVAEQARHWSKKVLEDSSRDDSKRVTGIYMSAFGRLPEKEEVTDTLEFLRKQEQAYDPDPKARQRAWADFCHVMFNTKEFIFIN